MGALWFWIVSFMLSAYVVFDGFDLGVGMLLPFVARTEEERHQAIRAIGPVWDGNEVWLIAAGGTLFFAFPLLYASAFSGFYMPLMIVLWLLILRGLGIELRHYAPDPLWRRFCEGLLIFSSCVLAVFFGAALANVIRGVPIGQDGFFYLALWTNWRVGPSPGILDWYTVIGGLMAVAALALHGALYLAVKTEGAVEERSFAAARRLWWVVAAGTVLSIPATVIARPSSLQNYYRYPAAMLAPAVVVLSLALIALAIRSQRPRRAFLASCAYLSAMFCGASAGLYPALLPATTGPDRDITINRALAGPHTIRVGLAWWGFGIALATLYFVVVYRLFRGKVSQQSDVYGQH
jgi:cytochrome d ubiquinol oxidase subunit II